MRAAGTNRSQGTRYAARAFARVLGCVLAATSALLLLAASPASALSQRGHEFKSETIGSGTGFGNGQFVGPTGVAVNERTGDIYVVDSGNNRVERFNSKHEFVAAWGWGVGEEGAKPSPKYEVCTAPAPCSRGAAGHGSGELHSARWVAVDSNLKTTEDPSGGAVYVETVLPYVENGKEFEKAIITKFSEDGEVLDEIKKFKSENFEEELNGIAVGEDGDFWVYNEENFYRFSNAVEPKALDEAGNEAEGSGVPGFAFDFKASSAGGFLAAHTLPGGETAVVSKDLLTEETIVGTKEKEVIALPTNEELDPLGATGVASDPVTGNAYVGHGSSIAAFDKEGEPIQTFGQGTITKSSQLAADGAGQQVLAADTGANRVEIFALEAPAPPTVDELSNSGITPTEATLEALIDPHGTASVNYAFRYSTGTVPKGGEPCTGECVQVPAAPATLPTVFGHQLVTAPLTGLSPLTVYHYRVFAESGGQFFESSAQGEGLEPGELSFQTQRANPTEVLPDARQWQLVSPPKKGGAALQVMPSEGGLSQASEDGNRVTYTTEGAVGAESEPEGNRAPEVTQLVSTRGPSSWSTVDIDTKHEKNDGVAPGGKQAYQQFSSDLSLAALVPFGSSSEQFESPPLSSETGEATPYVRRNDTCAAEPANCFQPLVTPLNVPEGTKYGRIVELLQGNESLDHVVLKATPHLANEAGLFPRANLYGAELGSPPSLKLINVLPEGEPIPPEFSNPEPDLGFKNGVLYNARHAVSADGSRYVWTLQKGGNPSALYVRQLAQARSIRLDVPEGGVTQTTLCTPIEKCAHPVFQYATKDDSTIFFTDEARLTKDAGATIEKPDLYACEVQEAGGELTGCALKDLSVGKPGEAGNVQGTVIGATEDPGTNPLRVYYVANGALGGAPAGNCVKEQIVRNKEGFTEGPEAQPIVAECNLYVQTREAGTWSAPHFVHRLSGEDEWDWGTKPGSLASIVSRVSPNGEWLAFMSDKNLTGYNTTDINSGHRAEEVYLYNASTEKTVCGSCNPTGARPDALLDREDSPEGIGPLIDRDLQWTSRRLAANIPTYVRISSNLALYQPKFLSDEGRLFFNSTEGLVTQDTNGKSDVYQYEPGGIPAGGCTTASETYVSKVAGCVSLISSGTAEKESAFLDAGANGDDAFFASPQKIVPQDIDTSYDVYDASICNIAGRPTCLPPPAASEPPCDEAEVKCRGGATGPPPSQGMNSEGASSGNNVSPQHEVLGSKSEEAPKPKPKPKVLTRAQKLKKALAACKKLKKQSKRHACEVQARKKYGAKKASHKPAHKSTRRGR